MKIEINLDEIKRAELDNTLAGDPDYPADLKATRILYNVSVGGRRTLEFAIIVPRTASFILSDDALQEIAETRFRETLEAAIRNEAIANRVNADLYESERKAFDALSRYKFQMFGYWAAIWVHLNRIKVDSEPSPFRELVKLAGRILTGEGDDDATPPPALNDH